MFFQPMKEAITFSYKPTRGEHICNKRRDLKDCVDLVTLRAYYWTQGPQGPTGPKGPHGPTGPQGPHGFLRFY